MIHVQTCTEARWIKRRREFIWLWQKSGGSKYSQPEEFLREQIHFSQVGNFIQISLVLEGNTANEDNLYKQIELSMNIVKAIVEIMDMAWNNIVKKNCIF